MSKVNIYTRDNILVDDKKLFEVLPFYTQSVECNEIKNKKLNIDSFELPDHFYYLMCSTNNNTLIETESNRHFT